MRIFARLKQRLKADMPQLFHVLKQAYALLRRANEVIRLLAYKIWALIKLHADRPRLRDYTLNYTVPVRYKIIDGRRDARCPVTHITEEVYSQTLKKIHDGTFEYYGATYTYLKQALVDFSVAGKSVIVYGLEACNCDMISIYNGAREVYVVEYQPPIHDHPRVSPFSLDDFEARGIQADAAFSISSFEHDGLGRYGDPMQPNADLLAMQNAKRHLKKGGILFFSVPVGADCLVYNAHRIYGNIRLPLMFEGWELLESYGFEESNFAGQVSVSAAHQPVFVLKKVD